MKTHIFNMFSSRLSIYLFIYLLIVVISDRITYILYIVNWSSKLKEYFKWGEKIIPM